MALKSLLKSRLLWGAIVVAGLSFWAWRRYRLAPDAAAQVLESPAVGVIEERFKESGEIKARDFVDAASKMSGRVIEVGVREGDKVSAGQALAVIQPGKTEAEKYVPSTVRAPIAGTVMRYVPDSTSSSGSSGDSRFVRLGDYVTGLFESQTPTYLMTVADLRRLIVRMDVSEMDVLKLSHGMSAVVEADALPGEPFPGHVSLIPPQSQKNQQGIRVFRVEVAIDRPDPRLKLGMTARVDALVRKKSSVLKVPLDAVFEEDGKEYVYIQNAADAKDPRKLEVKLGLRSDMEAEVIKADGLTVKDKLLTEPPKGFGGGS